MLHHSGIFQAMTWFVRLSQLTGAEHSGGISNIGAGYLSGCFSTIMARRWRCFSSRFPFPVSRFPVSVLRSLSGVEGPVPERSRRAALRPDHSGSVSNKGEGIQVNGFFYPHFTPPECLPACWLPMPSDKSQRRYFKQQIRFQGDFFSIDIKLLTE